MPALLAVLLLTTACARIASPEGWAAPVTDGKVVLIQSERGVITALRITNDSAEPLWSYPATDNDPDLEAVYATPVIDRGTAYIAGYSGTVVALNLSTNPPRLVWGSTVELQERIVATPALYGGLLYIVTEEGRLHMIDAATGDRVAEPIEIGGRIWARPIIDARRIYVAGLDRPLSALGRSSGEPQWTRDIGPVGGDPLLDGDLLLVPSFDRRLHALDLSADGAELWTADAGKGDAWFWARPLVAGDSVYAAAVNGSVYAFDRNDGSLLWRFHPGVDTEVRAAPILVDGVLIVATRDGDIRGISPSDGTEQWSHRVEGERFFADPLVLESGVVIFADDSGGLWQVTPTSGRVRQLFERS